MAQAVHAVATAAAPELAERTLEDVRQFIADQRDLPQDEPGMETDPDMETMMDEGDYNSPTED